MVNIRYTGYVSNQVGYITHLCRRTLNHSMPNSHLDSIVLVLIQLTYPTLNCAASRYKCTSTISGCIRPIYTSDRRQQTV